MTTREIDLRKMEDSLNAWDNGIKRLRSQVKNYDVDTQLKYKERLTRLSERWQMAQNQLQVYRSSAKDKLSDVEAGFNRTIKEIQQEFAAIVRQLVQQENLPLGWAEGMAEQLPPDSAGWAEGLAETPHPTRESEGWAEGQAEEEKKVDTVGWAEGYKKQ